MAVRDLDMMKTKFYCESVRQNGWKLEYYEDELQRMICLPVYRCELTWSLRIVPAGKI